MGELERWGRGLPSTATKRVPSFPQNKRANSPPLKKGAGARRNIEVEAELSSAGDLLSPATPHHLKQTDRIAIDQAKTLPPDCVSRNPKPSPHRRYNDRTFNARRRLARSAFDRTAISTVSPGSKVNALSSRLTS